MKCTYSKKKFSAPVHLIYILNAFNIHIKCTGYIRDKVSKNKIAPVETGQRCAHAHAQREREREGEH